MSKLPLLLTVIFALSACSSNNPFENTRGNWRIDGNFVNFKTTSLPGTYFAESEPDLAYLNLSPEGRIEFQLPHNDVQDCQLHVSGELVTIRQWPASTLKASAEPVEFSFGSFKGTYSPDNTHVLVVLTDLNEKSEPRTISIEKIFQGEVIETVTQRPDTSESSEEASSGETEEMDPATACLSWDITNNYDYARMLFMLPVQWVESDLIVNGMILHKD